MTDSQQLGSINVQNGEDVEKRNDGPNIRTPPTTVNQSKSNVERMLHTVLRNEEMMSARIDLIEPGSSDSESMGEPRRSVA